jgi:hypothetical protein
MALGGKRPGAGRKKGVPNKATADVKAAAQKYTSKAVKVLATIMEDKDQAGAARVAAANAILDRGYGKPTQAVNHGGNVTVRPLADFYGDPTGAGEGDA